MKGPRSPKPATSQTSHKTRIRVPHMTHQATPSIPADDADHIHMTYQATPSIPADDADHIPMNHQATPSIAADDADHINSVLPDMILEEILAKLCLTSIARVAAVCNKWKKITQSTTFMKKFLDSPSRKSWFLMLRPRNQCDELVYDHALENWRNFYVPRLIIASNSPVASASGLICSSPGDENIYVYNPINKLCRRLVDRPTRKFSWIGGLSMFGGISGLSISVGKNPRSYTVAIISSVSSVNRPGVQKLLVDVYSSDKLSWETSKGFAVRALDILNPSCVICDGVLYSVVYSGALGIYPATIWACDLASPSLDSSSLIQFPCCIQTAQVMNIKGKLVIAAAVGFIGGITIWLLEDKKFVEVATSPTKYFQRFVSDLSFWDKVLKFGSSGFDEIIYIWNGGMPDILMFDMVSGQWSWATRCPFIIGDFFIGLCIDPRIDTVP